MTALANQGPGFMRNRSADGGATGRRVRWRLTRVTLRNKKKETPYGGGVSLLDRDTALVLQESATFIGKVTTYYLYLFLHAPALASLSKLAASSSTD